MKNRIATGDPLDHLHMRFNRLERESLRELAASTKLKDRVLCLDWLWNGTDVRANVNFIIELAGQLAWDRREDVRWYACVRILGSYVRIYPHKIWGVITRLGITRSPDLRSAVEVALLEHLLEYHHDEYFPKVREKIEAGDRKMLEMLAISYYVGQAALHEDEINAVLIENHASVAWTGPGRGTKLSLQDLEEMGRAAEEAIEVIEALIRDAEDESF